MPTVLREALQVYLQLPDAPEFIAASVSAAEPAVAQLRANVLHLQSQLTLAHASLQAKDAAIQALSVANFQLNQLPSRALELPGASTADAQATQSDKEPVPGNFVSVTNSTRKALKSIFRRCCAG